MPTDTAHQLINQLENTKSDTLHQIWDYLINSESMLINIMDNQAQDPAVLGKGHPQFGAFLFYLNHPDFAYSKLATAASRTPLCVLSKAANIPRCRFSQDQLEFRLPRVDGEGRIYGFKKYETLDPLWMTAISRVLAQTLLQPVHPFGNQPYIGALQANPSGTVRIGIVGNWGAGEESVAPEIMGQLSTLNNDYLLHLGDVYYAGTDSTWTELPFAGEVKNNFLNFWPATQPERSFAINSNHEMYSGGYGYFAETLANSRFQHQNQTSYFMLTFGEWIILGLDSAYHAGESHFFMDGALGDNQCQWLKSLAEQKTFADKKLLVLTHHTGYQFTGKKLTALWAELKTAIGREPDVWYWAHIHNGIAYSDLAVGGATTKARCVGHSSIPFGEATDLLHNDKLLKTVDYFAHTFSGSDNRVLNGFATLELSADGGLVEKFYDLHYPKPVWSKTS
jgi:hypothetical protein